VNIYNIVQDDATRSFIVRVNRPLNALAVDCRIHNDRLSPVSDVDNELVFNDGSAEDGALQSQAEILQRLKGGGLDATKQSLFKHLTAKEPSDPRPGTK
jgi:hypothetical protein